MSVIHKARRYREGRDEGVALPWITPEEVADLDRRVEAAFRFYKSRLTKANVGRDYYQPHVIYVAFRDPWGQETKISLYGETLFDWMGREDPFGQILDAAADKIARSGVARLLGCRPGEVMQALQRRYSSYEEAVRQWRSALATAREHAERLLGVVREGGAP